MTHFRQADYRVRHFSFSFSELFRPFKNASAFLPRRARRVSAFHCARLRSAGGFYLSGGLRPATETSRISFYPQLVEAGVFPTEIKKTANGAKHVNGLFCDGSHYNSVFIICMARFYHIQDKSCISSMYLCP